MTVKRTPRAGLAFLCLSSLAVSAAGLVSGAPAAAVSLTVAAWDTGYYSNSELFPHAPENTDYIAGYFDYVVKDGHGVEQDEGKIDIAFRDFFVFDLPAAPSGATLVSATLRARNFRVVGGPQQMFLHGFQGSIADLVDGSSSFDALGQGPSYSSYSFSGAEDSESFSAYALDAAGLALVNSALGGPIAFSGRNSEEVGGGTTGIYVYGESSSTEEARWVFLDLQFEGGEAVPGPLPLFGAGAAWGWSRRLRRRCR